jgi:hypothetical protein
MFLKLPQNKVLVMELKRLLLILSVVLLGCGAASAQEGFELLKVPTGSIKNVDTEIGATIENWGYDKIFVALPDGWSINNEKSGATRSYAVREASLWRIYGRKDDPSSLLGSGEVFTGTGFQSGNPIKPTNTLGTREGWWLRPNEGVDIDIYVSSISGEGTIDPLKIEKENPSIRVIRWYESFKIEVSEPGFITAPWTVEGAALVESSRAVYSSAGKEGANVYYEKYQKETADAPAWDEWFNLKNSLVYQMTDTRLASIDLELPSLDAEDVVVTIKPVWRVDNLGDITYAYEWKSYKKVESVTIWRDTALDIPEWFELF